MPEQALVPDNGGDGAVGRGCTELPGTRRGSAEELRCLGQTWGLCLGAESSALGVFRKRIHFQSLPLRPPSGPAATKDGAVLQSIICKELIEDQAFLQKHF